MPYDTETIWQCINQEARLLHRRHMLLCIILEMAISTILQLCKGHIASIYAVHMDFMLNFFLGLLFDHE